MPSDESQIQITAGDEISVIRKDPSGWWYGETVDGEAGWYNFTI